MGGLVQYSHCNSSDTPFLSAQSEGGQKRALLLLTLFLLWCLLGRLLSPCSPIRASRRIPSHKVGSICQDP